MGMNMSANTSNQMQASKQMQNPVQIHAKMQIPMHVHSQTGTVTQPLQRSTPMYPSVSMESISERQIHQPHSPSRISASNAESNRSNSHSSLLGLIPPFTSTQGHEENAINSTGRMQLHPNQYSNTDMQDDSFVNHPSAQSNGHVRYADPYLHANASSYPSDGFSRSSVGLPIPTTSMNTVDICPVHLDVHCNCFGFHRANNQAHQHSYSRYTMDQKIAQIPEINQKVSQHPKSVVPADSSLQEINIQHSTQKDTSSSFLTRNVPATAFASSQSLGSVPQLQALHQSAVYDSSAHPSGSDREAIERMDDTQNVQKSAVSSSPSNFQAPPKSRQQKLSLQTHESVQNISSHSYDQSKASLHPNSLPLDPNRFEGKMNHSFLPHHHHSYPWPASQGSLATGVVATHASSPNQSIVEHQSHTHSPHRIMRSHYPSSHTVVNERSYIHGVQSSTQDIGFPQSQRVLQPSVSRYVDSLLHTDQIASYPEESSHYEAIESHQSSYSLPKSTHPNFAATFAGGIHHELLDALHKINSNHHSVQMNPQPGNVSHAQPQNLISYTHTTNTTHYASASTMQPSVGANAKSKAKKIVNDGARRWLKGPEILDLLQNYRTYDISLSLSPPSQPESGRLFLFDKFKVKGYRSDGHIWKRKNNGRSIKENHEKLKVHGYYQINCAYNYLEANPCFQRRLYWLIERQTPQIVLVHYFDVSDFNESSEKQAPVDECVMHPGQQITLRSNSVVPATLSEDSRSELSSVEMETQSSGQQPQPANPIQQEIEVQVATPTQKQPDVAIQSNKPAPIDIVTQPLQTNEPLKTPTKNLNRLTAHESTIQMPPSWDSSILNPHSQQYSGYLQEGDTFDQYMTWADGPGYQAFSIHQDVMFGDPFRTDFIPGDEEEGFLSRSMPTSGHNIEQEQANAKHPQILEVSPSWVYSWTVSKVIIIVNFIPEGRTCYVEFDRIRVIAHAITSTCLRCITPLFRNVGAIPLRVIFVDTKQGKEVVHTDTDALPNSIDSANSFSFSVIQKIIRTNLPKKLSPDYAQAGKLSSYFAANERAFKARLLDRIKHMDRYLYEGDLRNTRHYEDLYKQPCETLLTLISSELSRFEEKTALVNWQDDLGLTLLHYAAALKLHSLVTMFVEYSTAINARDFNGMTPLHWAAGSGKESIASTLLEHGADAAIKDNAGVRPFEIALANDHDRVALLLAETDMHASGLSTMSSTAPRSSSSTPRTHIQSLLEEKRSNSFNKVQTGGLLHSAARKIQKAYRHYRHIHTNSGKLWWEKRKEQAIAVVKDAYEKQNLKDVHLNVDGGKSVEQAAARIQRVYRSYKELKQARSHMAAYRIQQLFRYHQLRRKNPTNSMIDQGKILSDAGQVAVSNEALTHSEEAKPSHI
eukprot:TRINITY_DN6665_c1_g1_i1.p1 TRINITY_DN6665_c1_g1~~TRINITY_DN6665_c1_g1_i1.p1  ORF type:complete len:1464 (+),score=260.27 TRINITY_DN6665_c1_g1_i1:241-4392(+)